MRRLALCYLGLGDCRAARRLLDRDGRDVDDMDIQDAFNYGMAAWGETGEAVAAWAVGDDKTALESAQRARDALGGRRGKEFSCWRYYRIVATDFLSDLGELEALIRGDLSRKPRFMTARTDS